MEITAVIVSLYVLFVFGGRADYVRIGKEIPELEVENYSKLVNNSYLKFKVISNDKKFVKFRLIVWIPSSRFISAWKYYLLPIESDQFVETNYGKDSNSLPQEVKEIPITHFVTNCEYIIPLPEGRFRFITGSSYPGIAKIFQGYNSSSMDEIVVGKNQTYFLSLSEDKNGDVMIEKVEEVPSSGIKEEERCSINRNGINQS